MNAEENTVIEDFQRQLPPFLTSAKKQEILDAIKDFPEKFNPYQYVKEDPFAEQGDIFADVPFYFYENNKKEPKIAMVLSNACDISPENKRYAPVKVITALLLKFDRFSDHQYDVLAERRCSAGRLHPEIRLFDLNTVEGVLDQAR